MSKRRMLKLIEVVNGRGRPNLVVALPGQLHSRSGRLLPWTTQKPPRTRTLVRGSGETDWWPLPDPLGHPAAFTEERAEAPKGLVVPFQKGFAVLGWKGDHEAVV